MDKIQQLQNIIDNSDNIVFFGGAGVSTESGIPDFRSVDGIYNQKYDYPPETILSHTFFMENTKEFYRFYHDKIIFKDAKPNAAHLKLAEMEEVGKLRAVVTQNIDNLHQAAGSRKVYELHGSIHRNYCMDCGKFHDFDYVAKVKGIPTCRDCDGIIKPDVVLYEEALDQQILMDSINAIANADVLIIGGTSLAVYPAAGLINYYSGDKLILINKSPTPYDNRADLVINDPIGEVLGQIKL